MSNSEQGLATPGENKLAPSSQGEFEKLSDEEREQLMHNSASTGSVFEKGMYLQMDRDPGDHFGEMFFRQDETKKYVEGNEVEVIIAMIDHYWKPDSKHKIKEDDWDDRTVEYSVDTVPSLMGIPDDVTPVLYKHTYPFKTHENGVKARVRFTEMVDALELTNGNIDPAVKAEYGLSMVKRLHIFVKDTEGQWNYEVPVIMSCGGYHFKNLINYLNRPELQNFVVKVKSLMTEEKDYSNEKKTRKMPVFDYEITEEPLDKQQQYEVLQFRMNHAKVLVEAFGSKVTIDEEEQLDASVDDLEKEMGAKASNAETNE